MDSERQGNCPDAERMRLSGGVEFDDEFSAHLGECGVCQAALDADLARDGILKRLHAVQELRPLRAPVGTAGELPEFARYRTLRQIGKGGQGRVYEAIQESTGRSVAIKVLHARIWDEERLRARVVREVAALGKLAHTGVCPVIDFVEEAQCFGVVMPFLEGETLARRAQAAAECFARTGDAQSAWMRVVAGPERGREDRPRSNHQGGLPSVLQLMEDIVEAVEAVHRGGIVHRDLKPANVIVCGNSRPVVLDFGVALDLTEDTPRLTQEGELRGTPTSMAPEQIEGKLDAVDARTDVYALGVMLYELLAFEAPFQGSLPLVLARASSGSVRRIRSINPVVPKDLEAVCMKAMASEPSRRYATAALMGADLARVRHLEPTVAKPVSSATRLLLTVRRRPTLSASLAAVAVLSIALVAVRAAGRDSLGRVQATYEEVWRHELGELAPSELPNLRKLLGDDFLAYEAADGKGRLAIFARHMERFRAEATQPTVELRSPRSVVREPRPSFVVAFELDQGIEALSLRVKDLELDEVVVRRKLTPRTEVAVIELPPESELAPGRAYEWSIRATALGGVVVGSDSARFSIATGDLPRTPDAEARGFGLLRSAHELLQCGLASEALDVLERITPPAGDPRAQAQLDLARVRAWLQLERSDLARDLLDSRRVPAATQG